MLDYKRNNIYTYKSDTVAIGQKKFILSDENEEIYAIIISATLLKEIIVLKVFENIETLMVLRKMI